MLSRMPPWGPMAEEFVDIDKLCAIARVTLDKSFIKRFKQVGHKDPDTVGSWKSQESSISE